MSALLGLLLVGTVDQIDAGVASVEWRCSRAADADVAFGFVPAHLLPAGTREGDRIRLRLAPSAAPDPGGELVLPAAFAPVIRRIDRARHLRPRPPQE